jgi:endo-1,4-beta-xylanase
VATIIAATGVASAHAGSVKPAPVKPAPVKPAAVSRSAGTPTTQAARVKVAADTDPAHRVIPIGTAVNLAALSGSDPLYRATLNASFTGVTPENEMKWPTTEPANGTFNFGPADQIVRYALAHGMSVHAHNLIWNNHLPRWLLAGTWTKAQLKAILKRHIQTEVRHFAGQVHEWDVVNEPFTNTGALANNIWLKVIGPDYIPLALGWAHAADPSAQLFINDYNIDWPGPREQAALALARSLLAAGVPLNGIGMEEHLSVNWSPSTDQLTQAMRDFAGLGLAIEVTEADVETTPFTGSPAEAQAAKAAVFSELAGACRAQAACQRFTVWGVSDAVSWLGAGAAGLPFGASYAPTPAWTAITAGLADPAAPAAS